MAKHTWYKAQKRLRDGRFAALTPAARAVLMALQEMLSDDPILEANVSTLAQWTLTDRKVARAAIEAIKDVGILSVEVIDRGKAGTFYRIVDPDQAPSKPQPRPNQAQSMVEASPKQTPTKPQVSPDQAPDKSSNNAGYSDSSLIRIEENRREYISPSIPLPGFDAEDASRLTEALKGKVLDPAEFVLGVSKAIGVSHGDKASDAWLTMPSSKRTAWLLVAWEKAITANAKARSQYIAKVIGTSLVEGTDLASPGDQSTCALPAAAAAPEFIDPERVRGVTRRQLLPLLNRAGWERSVALRWCAEAPVEELTAKLRELSQGVNDGAA